MNYYCLVASCLILFVGTATVSALECSITPDPSALKFPDYDQYSEYLILIGRSSIQNELPEESIEYYNADRNISVSISRSESIRLRSYAYYRLGEVLIQRDEQCRSYDLHFAEDNNLSPLKIDRINGKKIYVSPMGLIIDNSLNFVYTGKNIIRGKQVDEWQVCYKSDTLNSDVKLTYSFNEKIPFQLIKEFTLLVNGTAVEIKEVFTLTEWRFTKSSTLTNTLTTENWREEDDFPPPGVFCKDKQQTFPIPVMPNSFELSLERFNDGTDSIKIDNIRVEYNYQAKLYRFDTRENGVITNQIVDLNTGLKYVISGSKGTCDVTRITSTDQGVINVGGKFQIDNPNTFFRLDESYVFLAFRNRNGVAAKVFGSNKKFNGQDAVWEWYFLVDEWKQQGVFDNTKPFPISLDITVDVPAPGKDIIYTFNFGRFREAVGVALNHDISRCEGEIKRKYLSFAFLVATDAIKSLIRDNIPLFELELSVAIAKYAKVTLLRVSQIDISFDGQFVFVVFTLYDRAKFYGEVDTPIYDFLLDDAVSSLLTTVNGGKFEFDLKVPNTTIPLTALELSFKEILDRSERFIEINKPIDEPGTSDGLTAFLTILATLVGIVLAVLVVYLHKRRTINVPYMKGLEEEK